MIGCICMCMYVYMYACMYSCVFVWVCAGSAGVQMDADDKHAARAMSSGGPTLPSRAYADLTGASTTSGTPAGTVRTRPEGVEASHDAKRPRVEDSDTRESGQAQPADSNGGEVG